MRTTRGLESGAYGAMLLAVVAAQVQMDVRSAADRRRTATSQQNG